MNSQFDEKIMTMTNLANWRDSLKMLEMPRMPELVIEPPKKEAEPKILTINKKQKTKNANGGLF